jgi:ankyrin repeat protein
MQRAFNIVSRFFLISVLGIGPVGCTGQSNDNLNGDNYQLFQETPIWDLAKAVRDENIKTIREIVNRDKLDLNYQEPKYGQTLLMLTVRNEQKKPLETLLELGADPNIYDTFSGRSVIIEAADIDNYPKNIEFINLLIKNGANPNDEEIGERNVSNTTRLTPLLAACRDQNEKFSPLKKVEFLVEAGAKVNYTNEYDQFPLAEALLSENMDVVLYLLQKGADYNRIIFDRAEYSPDGEKVYITNFLREKFYTLNSEKYKQKMEVVDFLSKKGKNYWTTPIPSYAIKEAKKMYPNSWQEYLKKY